MNEQEFTGLRSENQGSKIELFGVVDLDSQHTYALKVSLHMQLLKHVVQYSQYPSPLEHCIMLFAEFCCVMIMIGRHAS